MHIALRKLETLSELYFLSENNENLKNEIINSLSEGSNDEAIKLRISNDYANITKEVNENSNIQIIIKNKTDDEVERILNELIEDHKEQGNLKRIESLEQKLINNLDENSYSELIKLKSQLNRE